ncbi:hypothetical protein WDU94_007400 [Cyamophila willieti]
MTLDKETYLQCLIPLHDDDESWKKDEVLCLRQMKSLPLTEQIRLLLKDVKIISTPKLKTFLTLAAPGEESEMKKFLQQHAMLVHGNWVVKSDVLYPKGSASPFCGVPGDVMATARDYLVFLFTQHVYVQKTQVTEKIRIPPIELSTMFEEIAKYHPNKGWKLILPPDDMFIAKNPDIVERTRMWFSLKHKQINETLSELSTAAATAGKPQSSGRKNSTRSRHDSSSDREGSRSRKNSTRSRNDSTSDVENSSGSRRKHLNSSSEKEKKESARARKDSESGRSRHNSQSENQKDSRKRKDSARSLTSDASDVEMSMGKPSSGPGGMESPSMKRKNAISARNNEEGAFGGSENSGQQGRRRKNSSVYESSESEKEMGPEGLKSGGLKRKIAGGGRERRRSGIENCGLENGGHITTPNSNSLNNNSIKNSPR